MIAALAWARAHWKHLSVAGAFAAAFGAGWLAHRPPPTPSVALREDTAFQRSLAESTQTTQEKAPAVTTIDETLYDPPTVALPTEQDCHPVKLIPVSMPGPVREVRHTVIETGPEVVRTQTVERIQEQERQQVSLTVTAQPSARWSLGAMLEDPLGAKRLQLDVGFRLIGPVWLRAAFTPSRGAPSAAIGAELNF